MTTEQLREIKMPDTTPCSCPVANSDLVDITIPALVIFQVVLVLWISIVKYSEKN